CARRHSGFRCARRLTSNGSTASRRSPPATSPTPRAPRLKPRASSSIPRLTNQAATDGARPSIGHHGGALDFEQLLTVSFLVVGLAATPDAEQTFRHHEKDHRGHIDGEGDHAGHRDALGQIMDLQRQKDGGGYYREVLPPTLQQPQADALDDL